MAASVTPMVPQDQMISVGNSIFTVIQGFNATLSTVNKLIDHYDELNLGAANSGFAALPTCATNPDGSMGQADPAPRPGNVIDNRIVTNLSFAISSYDIGEMLSLCQQFQALMTGNAVQTKANAPNMLAKVTTG